MAEQKTVTEQTQARKLKTNIPGIYATGAVCFIVLLAIVLALYWHGNGSLVNTPIATVAAGSTAAGLGIFAIFYILAQFDERVVEPFSNLPWLGGHDDANNEKQKSARVVAVWGLASGIGILLCYLTVGLFEVIGITFSGSALQGHLIDAIISGVIVGAGTKPLHDFINMMDAKSA